MPQNKSNTVTDDRLINQVIYEKALLGKVPTYFRIEGDSRFHPVIWTMHPHLTEVEFSDGTTSHVHAGTVSAAVAEKVGPSPREAMVATSTTEPESVTGFYGRANYAEYTDGSDVIPSTPVETQITGNSDVDSVSAAAIAKLFSPDK